MGRRCSSAEVLDQWIAAPPCDSRGERIVQRSGVVTEHRCIRRVIDDEVWAAAGTWNDNFGAAPADIVRVAGGVVTDLKRD